MSLNKELEEIEDFLKELESNIKRVKVLYDQFFMGFEKREPSREREKLKKIFRNSNLHRHKKAAVKFRFMNLLSTFSTMQNYWDRILKQMELGTFDKLKFRGFKPRTDQSSETVKSNTGSTSTPNELKTEKNKQSSENQVIEKETQSVETKVENQNKPKEPLEETRQYKELYEKYSKAKDKKENAISYDKFVKRLNIKGKKLKELYNDEFEFDVVQKKDKVSVVARRKKK